MDFNIRKPVVLAAGYAAIFGLLATGPRSAQAAVPGPPVQHPVIQESAGDKGDTTIIIKPPIIVKDPKK
jgi:hypothetical protein